LQVADAEGAAQALLAVGGYPQAPAGAVAAQPLAVEQCAGDACA
jgi:hypothetical protein